MKSNEFPRGKPSSGNREQLEAGLNKLGALALILLGLWISTQRFAASVNYDPGWLGLPFYIIRSPLLRVEAFPLRASAYKKFVKIDIKEEWEGKRNE
ncbi:MAG: hypothetical protein LBG76_00980 [Treponema sp.]|nr:hypothetical protein [Treponema sp.]